MCRQPREQSARPLACEVSFGEAPCGANRVTPESGERDWVERQPQRGEQLNDEGVPIPNERLHQLLIRGSVATKSCRGCANGAFQNRGCAVVKRMGYRGGRVDVMESVLIQRQGAKKRRTGGERMHRRADVVNEARQRQLCGASTAAYCFCGFANEHGAARARQSDRGRQTVRP